MILQYTYVHVLLKVTNPEADLMGVGGVAGWCISHTGKNESIWTFTRDTWSFCPQQFLLRWPNPLSRWKGEYNFFNDKNLSEWNYYLPISSMNMMAGCNFMACKNEIQHWCFKNCTRRSILFEQNTKTNQI